ncbi:gibberellin-regulated protein 3-like [Andrographis paniculata]|uniref:gibberellin-regulated protein 3-like n=1 Tax=Andrographis paniculata TaxID=175694 RepID=UPI0021E811E6|nr:gibberellin-regulated protein 3-like [Andrographis paniculata]
MIKLLSVLLVALLLLQDSDQAEPSHDSSMVEKFSSDDPIPYPSTFVVGGDEGSLAKKPHFKRINCGRECSRRCGKSSRKNLCHRSCNSCCIRCRCVPPGTFGNKHMCPCYARLRTRHNKFKCP